MDTIPNPLTVCRVCGYIAADDYFPWGQDGTLPLFEFCECCGVEFGYQDCLPTGARAFRERWIANGTKWSEPKHRPADWDLDAQLANIPLEYR